MKGIACVILILGLLKFAQDAPNLFKSIFSFGGDLLKGMSLDPRGQLRNDFTTATKPVIGAAQRTGSTIAGGIGGLAAGIARGVRQAGHDHSAVGGQDGFGRKFHTFTAGVAGGLRGMVRGGRNGFQNSSGNMFDQLISGSEQGNIAAQMNSQRYRDGGSTNILERTLNRGIKFASDTWNDHIADPMSTFAGNVSGRNTASEAAQMFTTTKANNTAAMTATGTDIALGDMKNAKDEAKNKIREANALGMSYDQMLDELGMTTDSVEDRAKQLLKAGYTVSGYNLDANGDLVKDPSKEINAKTLQDIVDGSFKSDKQALLQTKFNSMNDENAKIIAEYNKETVDNLKENLSLLGQDDVNLLIKGLSGNTSFQDLGITTGTDSQGNMTFQHNGASITGSQAMDLLMNQLSQSTKAESLKANGGADGAQSMMQLDALQTELKKVNDTITNRKALEEHQKSQRRSSNSSDSGSSSSGGNSSSGSGGAS